VRSAWQRGERGGFSARAAGFCIAVAAALVAFVALELIAGAGLHIPIGANPR
jgi:hypothetical protein